MAPLIQRRLNRGQSSSVEFRLGLYVAGEVLDAVRWFEPHFEERWHLFGDNANILDNRYRGYLIGGLMLILYGREIYFITLRVFTTVSKKEPETAVMTAMR